MTNFRLALSILGVDLLLSSSFVSRVICCRLAQRGQFVRIMPECDSEIWLEKVELDDQLWERGYR